MKELDTVRILAILSLRNLWSHKVKSSIVGAIMLFGTFLVVSGSAILDSIEASMAKSITSSMAGDVQIYSADAKDELSLFGGFGFGSVDIGEIDDFAKVRDSLLQVENVKDVVPMGSTIATVFGANDIDRALLALREAVQKGDDPRAIELAGARVRRIAENVAADYELAADIQRDKDKVARDREALARATSDAFWTGDFVADPIAACDFLEGRIAPLAADARMLYLRSVGTDLDQFQRTFDRLRIVDGEMVPKGKRGYLMSKRTYEKFVKNLVARDLDDIKEEWDKGTRIADDTLLAERVQRNSRQYQRILFQLDPTQQAHLHPLLKAELKQDGELAALIEAFLKVDDATIEHRYAFFYNEIAPLIRLYDVKVGDVITLRAYTKAGYARSVNVRIYGTYEFQGLEKSDLAGAANLTDLVTWRELYGKMSADQLAELSSITEAVGVVDVSRENAEDALFGGSAPAIETIAAPSAGFDPFADMAAVDRETRQAELDDKVYSTETLQSGLALNAAVILKDPSELRETMKAIEAKSKADGLNLKVIDWQTASGIVGQFILVMRVVLYLAIFVIFGVALVIINNSMVMATMERTPEVGTMRAIGAQRPFVAALFIAETMLLGLVSGGAGALLAAVVVTWLGQVGIPAPSDILVFLFAGPRLFPGVHAANIAFGIGVILIVSVLSTLYPALLAAWVQPVVAMRGKE